MAEPAGDSNINEVAKWLDDTIDGVSFELPGSGPDPTLGHACARAVAKDIHDSAKDVQQEPDATEFPENDDRYAAYKDAKYGRTGRAFGFRTGQTFSMESLMGTISVQPNEVEMAYGTGRPVSKADGGNGYVSESDKDQTDIEKMYLLTNVAAKRIDPYKIGPYAEAEIVEILAEGLERHIKSRDQG